MVLTGSPDAEARDTLISLTGLTADRFEGLYWVDRLAYDEGRLSGIAFWQKFLADAGLGVSPSLVEELNRWDARMWTTQDSAMLAWQLQLKQRGLRTAILSNMGDSVLENIKHTFDWLDRFDVLVWSYQIHMVKPDPAIYLHTLRQLGTNPEESLFIDDRQINVDAARALGMPALQFSTIERLRADLVSAGLDSELPLPA